MSDNSLECTEIVQGSKESLEGTNGIYWGMDMGKTSDIGRIALSYLMTTYLN